jgi:hypothetical protein
MNGFSLNCPVCLKPTLPEVGLLHLALALRWAYHLFNAHPYEAHVLRLHLNQPPDEWPVIEPDEEWAA